MLIFYQQRYKKKRRRSVDMSFFYTEPIISGDSISKPSFLRHFYDLYGNNFEITITFALYFRNNSLINPNIWVKYQRGCVTSAPPLQSNLMFYFHLSIWGLEIFGIICIMKRLLFSSFMLSLLIPLKPLPAIMTSVLYLRRSTPLESHLR